LSNKFSIASDRIHF